ncbi:MAG TPA: hypothetical protein VIY86_09265 [Pirellulaceae bacterium]
MRSALVTFLIGTILTCPLTCTLRSVVARFVGRSTGCCQPCCQGSMARHVNKCFGQVGEPCHPTPPLPQKDGRWCLCYGVVHDAGTRHSADDARNAEVGPLGERPEQSIGIEYRSPSWEGGLERPPRDGRSTRIQFHSLLIYL